MPEETLKQLDKQAVVIEYQSATVQWTEWNVPGRTFYPNNKFETFNIYIELMDLDVKVLLDSVKNGESNELCFGLLSLMCKL